MFKCPYCCEEINGKTDDHYNTAHTKIQCPHCKTWLIVDDLKTVEDMEIFIGNNKEQSLMMLDFACFVVIFLATKLCTQEEKNRLLVAGKCRLVEQRFSEENADKFIKRIEKTFEIKA